MVNIKKLGVWFECKYYFFCYSAVNVDLFNFSYLKGLIETTNSYFRGKSFMVFNSSLKNQNNSSVKTNINPLVRRFGKKYLKDISKKIKTTSWYFFDATRVWKSTKWKWQKNIFFLESRKKVMRGRAAYFYDFLVFVNSSTNFI